MVEFQLGTWDLSELAKNPKSPAFQKQIQELEDIIPYMKKKIKPAESLEIAGKSDNSLV